jgi:hypothetical protein
MVLSVLRFTYSDYHFGIFKLFLTSKRLYCSVPRQFVGSTLIGCIKQVFWSNPTFFVCNWLDDNVQSIGTETDNTSGTFYTHFMVNRLVREAIIRFVDFVVAYSGVQHILCCVLVLFVFVLCTICCLFLWNVHFWLPHRYYPTFI